MINILERIDGYLVWSPSKYFGLANDEFLDSNHQDYPIKWSKCCMERNQKRLTEAVQDNKLLSITYCIYVTNWPWPENLQAWIQPFPKSNHMILLSDVAGLFSGSILVDPRFSGEYSLSARISLPSCLIKTSPRSVSWTPIFFSKIRLEWSHS